MAARRVFLPRSEREEGRLRPVYRLQCRVCGSQQPKLVCTAEKGYPPEMIIKHMIAKGWDVGRRDGDDICPSCVTRRQEKRRELKLVAKEDNVVVAVPMKKPEAEKPRQPSITEVLIILAKLDEVFDPKVGYLDGMTDAKIAADLNCPRAWVADVRRNKFGEVGANDEIKEVLAKVAHLKEVHDKLAADHAAAVAGFNAAQAALKAEIDQIMKMAAQIEATIR